MVEKHNEYEVVGRGYVKKARGRPPKNDNGVATIADVTLDNPLFDDDLVDEDVSVEVDKPNKPTYIKPEISRQKAAHFQRLEEIEDVLVKTEGRFIDHVDNAKAGVPYKVVESNDPLSPFLEGMQQTEQNFALPLINTLNIRADGFVSEGGRVLDTGTGAQEALNEGANPHDPKSKAFMVCVNKLCQYRQGCLRYRLNNRRDNKFPFHPSECRKDGIYISLDDSKFSAYDPFEMIDSAGLPNANDW